MLKLKLILDSEINSNELTRTELKLTKKLCNWVNNTPLYFQLETLIKRCISSGLVKAGDLLPSEAEFCRSFGVSRSTVRQAIGELEEEQLEELGELVDPDELAGSDEAESERSE